ncbi:MAG TPA: hypothetical protein VHS97_13530 [Isosphaeraceae bacterium]|jgi:hypothetical protein|nr:hypothetical protein [Isosphaeraceae bacterium]
MVSLSLRISAILELVVILFQIVGVAALCVSRLLPSTRARWANRGRVGFVVAMIGLGFAGAVCGGQDSEFGLFAGGTMTILLIGMIVGNGHTDATVATRSCVAEPKLAG